VPGFDKSQNSAMQTDDTYGPFIQFLQRFEQLPQEVAEHIESLTIRKELPRKTLLLKSGSTCDYLYYIGKGLARNFYKAKDKEYTTDIAIDGKLITSFASFTSRKPSNENIELLEDSVLYGISYSDLQLLYRTYPIMERIGRIIAEHHYNSLAAHTYLLKFSSSAERYEHLFTSRLELVKRAPIGIIASYLGMTIETLSRIRSRTD
jgi:CRP-like cAMP-binding protein